MIGHLTDVCDRNRGYTAAVASPEHAAVVGFPRYSYDLAVGTGHASVPFVGREREISELSALLARVQRGAGAVAVVEGEAGIGKTRLIEEFIDPAAKEGLTPLRAAARDTDRERPFGVVAEALELRLRSRDSKRAALAELLVAPAGAGDLRYRIVEEIQNLVEQLALAKPRLLVVEDLHWADPSSLLALRRLVPSLEGLPVFLLVSARPAPQRGDLRGLVDELPEAGALRIELGPLDEPDVATLVTHVLGEPPDAAFLGRVAGAGGNPLFVTELASAVRERAGTGDSAAEADAYVPRSVRETILRRIAFLTPESLELLQLASVLGTAFVIEDLAAMAARPPTDLVHALRLPIQARILVEDGDRLAFRHDLVREALYLDLPQPLRRSLHLQAARSLAALNADPVDVAGHFTLGARAGDAEAVEWLSRAADAAAPRAPVVAAAMLERALEIVRPEDAGRDDLLRRLVMPLILSGRSREAEALARDVLRRAPDPALAAPLRTAAWAVCWLENRVWDYRDVVRAALEDPGLPEHMRPEMMMFDLYIQASEGPLERADLEIDDLIAFADRVGCPYGRFAGRLFKSIAAAIMGRPSQAAAHARDMSDVSDPVRLPPGHAERLLEGGRTPAYLHANARVWESFALMGADRLAEAEAAAREAYALFEHIGAVAFLAQCHWALANVHFLCGRWDDALAEADASRLLGEEAGGHSGRLFLPDPSIWINLHRGHLPAARMALSRSERHLPRADAGLGINWPAAARAVVLEAAGDEHAALVALRELFAFYERFQGAIPDPRLASVQAVRLAVRLGEREFAESVVGHAEKAARADVGTSSVVGAALVCRGLLEGDVDVLLRAVGAYEGAPRPFDLAVARETASDALAAAGRRDEAIPLLEQALEDYAGVAAAAAEARVRGKLRELGVRLGARGTRHRAETGWESLTPSEQRVAELVVEGLTNPQIGERLFISRRTVATHLSHTYRKLGLSSRSELAAEAARQVELAAEPDRSVS